MSEPLYNVEAIRKKRIDKKGKPFYLIKWEGYPESQNTWEPPENLVTIQPLVDAFEESLKSKPTQKSNKYINKKRKSNQHKEEEEESEEESNSSDRSEKENNENNEKYNQNYNKKAINNEEDKELFLKIDPNIIEVITVKKINGIYFATINVKKDNKTVQECISTEELKKINPLVLIDFYESKIRFT